METFEQAFDRRWVELRGVAMSRLSIRHFMEMIGGAEVRAGILDNPVVQSSLTPEEFSLASQLSNQNIQIFIDNMKVFYKLVVAHGELNAIKDQFENNQIDEQTAINLMENVIVQEVV